MAITRVYGLVDGVEVIMSPDEGDWWSVPVPLDPDGKYVVEIIAENDAGNRTCMTRLLFCADSSDLHVKMRPLPYGSLIAQEKYTMKMHGSVFSGAVVGNRYRAVVLPEVLNCKKMRVM